MRTLTFRERVSRRTRRWRRHLVDAVQLIRAKRQALLVRRSMGTSALPFDPEPPYRTYLDSTYPLSILGAHHDLSAVLASHYINFRITKTERFARSAFTPWLKPEDFVRLGYFEGERVPAEPRQKHILDFLITSLRDGWYIYATANEFFVKGTRACGFYDFKHPALIIGFDKVTDTFQWVTYLAGRRNTLKYGITHVPCTAAILALCHRRTLEAPGLHWPPPTRLRPRASGAPSFDRECALRYVESYIECCDEARPAAKLSSSDSAQLQSPHNRFAFGLSTYEEFVRRLTDAIHQRAPIDLRDTRSFHEHKSVIRRNISYWRSRGHAGATTEIEYLPVLAWSNIVHLQAIKHNLFIQEGQRQPQTLHKTLSGFEQIRELDRRVMATIAESLAS